MGYHNLSQQIFHKNTQLFFFVYYEISGSETKAESQKLPKKFSDLSTGKYQQETFSSGINFFLFRNFKLSLQVSPFFT